MTDVSKDVADAHDWVADVLRFELLYDRVPTRLAPYVEALVDDLAYSVYGADR